MKGARTSKATEDNFYWYDGLNQVTRHDRGDLAPSSGAPYTGINPATRQQQEIFTFDETGNWQGDYSQNPALSQGRTHNAANQITAIAGPTGAIQPAYDEVGNMTTMPKAGAWTTANTLQWDAWNRLVKLTEGSTQISYAYDALTRRVSKAKTGETRRYYYDRQWRCVEERVSNAVNAQYVWSPLDRWTMIRRKRSTGSSTLNETRYVLKDYLDPTAIVDPTGTVMERYRYDAFGPVKILTPNFSARNTSECGWNFLFHAEFLDEDSGLYNYGYRVYHPELGRWLSRDPIQERGGTNLYGFIENDGMNHWDFLGLKKNCTQEEVDNLVNNDPTIKDWKKRLNSAGYPIPKFECQCCKKSGGIFPCAKLDTKNNIVIICDNAENCTDGVKDAIKHELVHASDKCAGTDFSKCYDRICSEIRAYIMMNPDKNTKWEIKRRVLNSILNRKCQNTYEKTFEAAWPKCSKSTGMPIDD